MNLLYLVLSADQLQNRIELDLFIHVLVDYRPLDMKPQAAAEQIGAGQKDARLTDPGLEGSNALLQGYSQGILLLACDAIEAVKVRQAEIEDRCRGVRVGFQFRNDGLSSIQEPLDVSLERLAIHTDGCGTGFRPLLPLDQPIDQRMRNQNFRLGSGQLFLPKTPRMLLLQNGCIQPLLRLGVRGASVVFESPVPQLGPGDQKTSYGSRYRRRDCLSPGLLTCAPNVPMQIEPCP